MVLILIFVLILWYQKRLVGKRKDFLIQKEQG